MREQLKAGKGYWISLGILVGLISLAIVAVARSPKHEAAALTLTPMASPTNLPSTEICKGPHQVGYTIDTPTTSLTFVGVEPISNTYDVPGDMNTPGHRETKTASVVTFRFVNKTSTGIIVGKYPMSYGTYGVIIDGKVNDLEIGSLVLGGVGSTSIMNLITSIAESVKFTKLAPRETKTFKYIVADGKRVVVFIGSDSGYSQVQSGSQCPEDGGWLVKG